jgi:prepilin-type N-terminal cleavage/methylation domain-containing protein
MKRFLKPKLKGNTIIEVLIALAILAFCSSLAVVIYLNIQKSSLPFFRLKAVELAEKHMSNTFNSKEFSDGNFQEEEFTVKRIVTTSPSFPDCVLIRVIVFDVNKKKVHEIEQTALKEN